MQVKNYIIYINNFIYIYYIIIEINIIENNDLIYYKLKYYLLMG